MSVSFRVFLGDALEVVWCQEICRVDALVTDPPYGIGFDFAKDRWNVPGRMHVTPKPWTNVIGDDASFDPKPWLGYSKVILWGANNFSDRLPASRGWLVWDKRDGRSSDDFGDAELAWTNADKVVRLYSQLWRGMIREGEEKATRKLHPCQKPVAMMRWCLRYLDLAPGSVVLDPFMGSGTTGVACAEEGFSFIGIEKDPDYFKVAEERVRAAYAQGRLFQAS